MTNSKIKINTDSLKSRREWKRHKVKDGHNVFRILPPFGEASNGYAYRKWQIIWGLKDPESQKMRPYASSLTSEKACPVFEFVKELKAKGETIKAKMQAAGKSEDEIKDRLATLNKLVSDLNPKTVYIYNAVDKAGDVGLLELKSTAHKKIKTEMLDYIHVYNQDPTSLNSADDDSGVWFDVIRTGMGRDTEYDVKKLQQRVKDPTTGKISFEDDRSPLPDSVVQNFEGQAYDLSSVYQAKTYDDLADILAANMPDLIDLCADADLGASVAVQAAVAVPVAKAKPTAKVALKFDADEEEDEYTSPVNTPAHIVRQASQASTPAPKVINNASTRKPAPAAADDDDFMSQAEALLNS